MLKYRDCDKEGKFALIAVVIVLQEPYVGGCCDAKVDWLVDERDRSERSKIRLDLARLLLPALNIMLLLLCGTEVKVLTGGIQ